MIAALTPGTQAVLACIVGLLAASTAAVAALTRLLPGTDFGDLVARTRTWWVMIGLVMLATVTGRTVTLLFLAFVSFFALREYLSMVRIRRADRAVLIWAYAAIPVQMVCIAHQQTGLVAFVVPVGVLFVLAANMVLIGETRGFIAALGTLYLGLMTTVFGLGHLAGLVVLPAAVNPAGGSTGFMVFLVFLAQFNDVIQYVAGRLLGRRPVLPRVSPNKTWAGLVSGFAATLVAAAVLAPWLTPFSPPVAVAAGALIALSGFAGDVMVSAIKRDLGVGDCGTLLPGHGGVLDRVDSLIFSAPLFYYFVQLQSAANGAVA